MAARAAGMEELQSATIWKLGEDWRPAWGLGVG